MVTTVNDRELRGSDFRVGISKQSVKGVINTNPVFDQVRRTEGKNQKVVNYVEDPSVNGNMQAKEQIKDSESLSAELQAVVTKQKIDWLIQAIHADIVDFTVEGTDIAFTATGITSAGNAFDEYFVGLGFWASGSATAANNIFYVVKEVTSAGEIVTEPAPPAAVAAGDSISLVSYVSQNRDLPTYNAMQTRARDLTQGDETNYYTQFDGVINEYSLEVPETGLWSCTANFLFEQEYDLSPAAIPGQTYSAPAPDRAVTSSRNATPGIRAFYVDNESQNCKIKSLSLSVANNYEEDPFSNCLMSYFRGDFAVTGSFIARSLVSNPFVWRDKTWNSTRFSFAFRLNHGNDEESYICIHQNVATETTMPDGSNTSAHAEVNFAAEEKLDIETTITVCTNWGITP